MADGNQWYLNSQDDSSKKKSSVNRSSVPVKKPAGSSAVSSAKRPAGAAGKTDKKSSTGKISATKGRAVPGVSGRKQQPVKGGTKQPANRTAGSANRNAPDAVKRNPESSNSQTSDPVKSIIPKMDVTGSTSKADPSLTKKAVPGVTPVAKPASPKNSDVKRKPSKESGKKQVPSKDKTTVKEQQKILAQEKRKEEAKLKEQAKIEKNEYKRKNPSQKSAESRAIRNGVLGAVAVTAALLVLVVIVHHLFDYIAEKPKFSFVTTGVVEHTIGAKALIVRDEDVINSNNAGELVTQITEGSRVARDQELAIVVPDNMQSVVQDLRNVQSQISDIQQEIIASGNAADAQVINSNCNKSLSAIIDSVRYDAMGGNLSNLSSYMSSVNVILDEREDEIGKLNFDDERLSVLRNDEAGYEAQLEKYASRVTAHRPGIVSFRLDGQEEFLSYDTFLNMPAAEVKNYINNSVGAISSDLSVEESSPVVRIAQNESQYLAVYLSSNDTAASDFAVGTTHNINVRTENVSIGNCKVVRCESDSSGALITFETSRYVEALLDLRTVDIEIVITETDGMKVSVPSLVNEKYAPNSSNAYCVYLSADSNVNTDTFAEGSIFNVTAVPTAVVDEEGNPVEQQNAAVAGCTVIHTETFEDGGTLVAFSTPSDYSNLKKLDRLYPDGYSVSFVDTATGLGVTVEKMIVTEYSGIASLYMNDQGFVEEVRVVILDNDREFAIIDQVGKSSVPNLDTVIITNPSTVKPGDKVD